MVFYYYANKHLRRYTVSLEHLYEEKRHPLKIFWGSSKGDMLKLTVK